MRKMAVPGENKSESVSVEVAEAKPEERKPAPPVAAPKRKVGSMFADLGI
jgi:hypothetical protein